jgi:hypothetical protein
MTGAHGWLG